MLLLHTPPDVLFDNCVAEDAHTEVVPLIAATTGFVFGDALAEPAALVQPFIVCVTLYVFALCTIIVDVVSFVLHNKPPVDVVESVDVLSQLSTTVITGVAGIVFGDATPEPAALVQPFIVCVTLYVFALFTVIVDVVSFVLHNKPPTAMVERVDVPSQLSTTVTTGVAGVVLGAATPEPAALVQPFTVCVTV